MYQVPGSGFGGALADLASAKGLGGGAAYYDLSPPLFVHDTVRMMREIVELYKNSHTAVEDPSVARTEAKKLDAKKYFPVPSS